MTEMAVWLDPALPFSVDYSCAALERVRQRASDGLSALPRIGMGVGGLLLGEHLPTGIRITGAIEIPCSHSLGPTFQLTPDEIRHAMQLLKNAGSHRGVVGIYCTRTRGDVVLGGPERELFELLCPEPWQVAFVVRPAPGEVARAAFFYRDKDGLQAGTAQELWEWSPPDLEKTQREVAARLDAISKVLAGSAAPPVPVSAPPVSAPPVSVIASVPFPSGREHDPSPAIPVPDLSVSAAVKHPPEPVMAEPRDPAAPPAAPAITASLFAQLDQEPSAEGGRTTHPQLVAIPRITPERPNGNDEIPLPSLPEARSSSRRTGLLLRAAGVIIVGLAVGAFATRDAWLPRPPLSMTAADTGGTMEIRWNAQATRGVDRAELLINDGGQLDSITLDSTKLLAGSFLYKRKSDRVTVTLDLGTVRGRTGYQPEALGAIPDPSAPPPDAAPHPPSGLLPTNDPASPSYGTAPPVVTAPVVTPPAVTAPVVTAPVRGSAVGGPAPVAPAAAGSSGKASAPVPSATKTHADK